MKLLRFSPFFSSLCAGLLLTGSASARLGETYEQCVARYGPPVAETAGLLQGAKSVSFAKAGIRVRVEFLGGKAAFLSFSKHGLTPDDELLLLDSNAGVQVWSTVQEFVGRRCWIAPALDQDEPRYANSYISGATAWLDIASKTWTDAMRAQKIAMTAALPKPEPKAPDAKGDAPAAGDGKTPAAPRKPGNLDGF